MGVQLMRWDTMSCDRQVSVRFDVGTAVLETDVHVVIVKELEQRLGTDRCASCCVRCGFACALSDWMTALESCHGGFVCTPVRDQSMIRVC